MNEHPEDELVRQIFGIMMIDGDLIRDEVAVLETIRYRQSEVDIVIACLAGNLELRYFETQS